MQFVVSDKSDSNKDFPVVAPGIYDAEITRARIEAVNQDFKARNAWMTWDYEVSFAFKLDNREISGGQWFWARAGLKPELSSSDRAVQWISAILNEPTLPAGFVLDDANINSLVGEKLRIRLGSKFNDNKQVYENKVEDILPALAPSESMLVGGVETPLPGTAPAYQPPTVAPPAVAPPAFQVPAPAPAAQAQYQQAPSVLDEPF